ncbi:MAG: polymer-forming cytoskeletal protein, partial [Halobacteria archaeon]|nr:polymer-forming cytoskeletal protein [Halobacteria archaeon]
STLVVLAVSLLVVGTASAQESRSGGAVVIESNETIDGMLTASGGSVTVLGTVDGDIFAYGRHIAIEKGGMVNGNVTLYAGSVGIDGNVTGRVQTIAGSTHIGENARVGGLNLDSSSIVVNGTVLGDAKLSGESIRLGSAAKISGNVTYSGNLERDEGAVVGGTVTERSGGEPSFPAWVFDVYALFANLMLGAILLVVFPDFSQKVSHRVRD